MENFAITSIPPMAKSKGTVPAQRVCWLQDQLSNESPAPIENFQLQADHQTKSTNRTIRQQQQLKAPLCNCFFRLFSTECSLCCMRHDIVHQTDCDRVVALNPMLPSTWFAVQLGTTIRKVQGLVRRSRTKLSSSIRDGGVGITIPSTTMVGVPRTPTRAAQSSKSRIATASIRHPFTVSRVL